MEKTKVFTVRETSRGRYSITSGRDCTYNRYQLSPHELFGAMQEITFIFNNEFDTAVLFEID